jgi:hypothetical protein
MRTDDNDAKANAAALTNDVRHNATVQIAEAAAVHGNWAEPASETGFTSERD